METQPTATPPADGQPVPTPAPDPSSSGAPAATPEERIAQVAAQALGPVIERVLDPQRQQSATLAELLEVSRQRREVQEHERGIGAAKVMMCALYAAQTKGGYQAGVDWAEKMYGKEDHVTRALTAGGAGGQFFIGADQSREFIDLLRPRAVFMNAGPQVISMPFGAKNLPKLTGDASAAYIGESQQIVSSQPATGGLQLAFKKLAGTVVLSNDWMRYQIPGAEPFVRDKALRVMANRKDLAFLRGTGGEFEPKGVLNFALPAQTFNATGGTTPTVQQVIDTLHQAIELLETANVDITKGQWFMSPRTKWFLMGVRDNGFEVFAPEIQRGVLRGFPFAVTTQIPNNLGGGSDESQIYFTNMDNAVVANSLQLVVEQFNEGAYWDGTQLQSLMARDESAVRLIEEHDLVYEHREAIAVIDAVQWGA